VWEVREIVIHNGGSGEAGEGKECSIPFILYVTTS